MTEDLLMNIRKSNNKKIWQLYLFLIPTLLYILIFKYIPMYGIVIAFKDYSPALGFLKSSFVGFKHFERFFSSYKFSRLIVNTLGLSVFQMLICFPAPIILALLINQIRRTKFKRAVQTILYAPHFISVVVLVGMMHVFLSPSTGIVNHFIELFGGKSIFFFGEPGWFKPLYVISSLWQSTGWLSIIYLAALSGIDPCLYEAATIDGASKWQKLKHIDIPGISSIIVILLILEVGKVMSVGFEKAFLMQTALNKSAGDIIPTYVYEKGILDAKYSFSTAVGLFNTIVNVLLLAGANYFSKRRSDTSLW